MKTGKTLVELAQEIERQAASKKDYIAPARKLTMELEENAPVLMMQNGVPQRLGITGTAHNQIAGRLGIPQGYYDRMMKEKPGLLAGNVNAWLDSDNRYMVRTLDGSARALLSDRYRPLDNLDLAECVLPTLAEGKAKVESCEITESRLYLKAVTPRITAEVKKGDIVQAGLIVSNSEIGLGAIKVEPLVFRLVCLNGAIVNDRAMKRQHVGRRSQFLELDNAEQYYRDETRQADDKAFWLKVRDVVKAMMDEAIFNRIVDRWREATEQKITADPVKVVERVNKRLGLSDVEGGGVLRHLIEGGDLSAYGLMNAITRTAQDAPSYDRSTELERMGPQILELPRQAWAELATV